MNSARPNTLAALADYVRKHSSFFITNAPAMLTPIARANRKKQIELLGDKIDELAGLARKGLDARAIPAVTLAGAGRQRSEFLCVFK
jgi:hypothetical protein